MATLNDLMKNFETSAGKFMKGIDQFSEDESNYSRLKELFEYKVKVQNLFAEWYNLLEKWDDDEKWKWLSHDLN